MIPLSVPNLCGNELRYVTECIETGWISTAGKFVSRFETEFAAWTGQKNAVSTSNGTAALHLALLGAGVQDNDLVIMPNVTFVATANAIKYVGAEPLLIDISSEDWQMDLELLEQFLNEDCQRTKDGIVKFKKSGQKIAAIMIVHLQGHICNLEKLLEIAKRWDLTVIEDAAEALGSKYKNQHAGTFGEFGCFSFNGNKIMSTGGGGMLIAKNQNDLEGLRHLATTAKTDPMIYHHDKVGYNYRLVNILAAVGLAQLEQLHYFVDRKNEIATFYTQHLETIGDITFQKSSKNVTPNHWLFTIRTGMQKALISALNEQGIMSRPFWMPMSTLPMYENCTFVQSHINISKLIHEEALSIPCSTNITVEELETVVGAIETFFE